MNLLKPHLPIATGPTRLRSELRRQTHALRKLSLQMGGTDQFKTTFPQTIFGGDLLELLSDRLQAKLLVDSAQSPVEQTSTPNRQWHEQISIPASSLSTQAKANNLSASPEKSNPFKLEQDTDPLQKTWPQPSISTPTANLQQSTNPLGVVSKANYYREKQLLAEELEETRTYEPVLPKKSRDHSANVFSALVKQLDTYWQLSQSQGLSNSSTSYPTSDFVRGTKSVIPEIIQHSPNKQAWPDKVGKHTASKLQEILTTAPNTSKTLSESITLPEKLELHNTFHIETKGPSGGEGTTNELAERLSEILREQALQHGIDIT